MSKGDNPIGQAMYQKWRKVDRRFFERTEVEHMMRSLESSEPSRPFNINEESQFADDALELVQLHQPSISAVLYCPTYAAVQSYQFPAAFQ